MNPFRYILSAILLLTLAIGLQAQTDAEHVRLTNLPHIYINTFTGRPVTSKTTTVLARMWYVDEQDNVAFYDSLEIRVRGNSTATLPKRPYRLKFQNKVKLLGKGFANAKKWTLLANHGDKTLLRNALTSQMGRFAGLPFNPAAKFVDLTLNNQYQGNYQLSDQVEVRPHRVDIAEQDYPLEDDSNITGGYLLEADGFADFTTQPQGPQQSSTGFYTPMRHVPVRIHCPDDDEIYPSQYSYIRQAVNDFELRLFSPSFTDPLTGYRPLVDSVTLANWYICTEVSANVDGFFSTYFYKERNDPRLRWGPLWDYDIAYNNDNRTDRGGTSNTERQLMKDHGYGANGNGCRQWFEQMWRDPWFARLVNRRYQELVSSGLEDFLYQQLDSLVTLIDQSQQLNYQRWGINTRALRERVLYSTYSRYIADLRTFIGRHMAWLTTAFASQQPDDPTPDDDDDQQPGFAADPHTFYTITNAGTGTCLDVDMATSQLCANHRQALSHSQQWRLVTLQNGLLLLVNRATGQAVSDPSPAGSTATTNTGATLLLAPADSADVRQLWRIVAQTGQRYNLVSRWSHHAANLNGGNAADGTRVLSYTSDNRDTFSNNRLWHIQATGTDAEASLDAPSMDYALAFDPQRQHLHFGADDVQRLTFRVTLYDAGGRPVATFRASDGCSLSALPPGLYIVSWTADGRHESVKLKK